MTKILVIFRSKHTHFRLKTIFYDSFRSFFVVNTLIFSKNMRYDQKFDQTHVIFVKNTLRMTKLDGCPWNHFVVCEHNEIWVRNIHFGGVPPKIGVTPPFLGVPPPFGGGYPPLWGVKNRTPLDFPPTFGKRVPKPPPLKNTHFGGGFLDFPATFGFWGQNPPFWGKIDLLGGGTPPHRL